jgi:LacI family transcriptional regulator
MAKAAARRIILLLSPASEHERRIIRGFCRLGKLEKPPWQVLWEEWKNLTDRPEELEKFDGAVILPRDAEELALVRSLLPCTVNVSTRFGPVPEGSVVVDNLAAGRLAGRHLRDRLHVGFAFVGTTSHLYSRERWQGFCEVVAPAEPEVFDFGTTQGDGLKNLRRFVGRLPPATGIFAANDIFARTVVQAGTQAGRHFPDDLSVVGMDADDMISLSLPVALSSVDPDSDRLGWEAARMLKDWMEDGRPSVPQVTIEPAGVIENASTNHFVTADAETGTAMKILRAEATQGLTVDDLAKRMGMGRRTLERRFHAAFGTGVAEQLRSERIRHACLLLRDSNLPVKLIAEQCGFSDLFYFSSAFRRSTGTSPTGYRESARSRY